MTSACLRSNLPWGWIGDFMGNLVVAAGSGVLIILGGHRVRLLLGSGGGEVLGDECPGGSHTSCPWFRAGHRPGLLELTGGIEQLQQPAERFWVHPRRVYQLLAENRWQ
jgi:hypothetical protein